jgi:hypothetical protein
MRLAPVGLLNNYLSQLLEAMRLRHEAFESVFTFSSITPDYRNNFIFSYYRCHTNCL